MLGTATDAAWPSAEAARWDTGITSCMCPNKLSIKRQHLVFSSAAFLALAFYLSLYLYLPVTLCFSPHHWLFTFLSALSQVTVWTHISNPEMIAVVFYNYQPRKWTEAHCHLSLSHRLFQLFQRWYYKLRWAQLNLYYTFFGLTEYWILSSPAVSNKMSNTALQFWALKQ